MSDTADTDTPERELIEELHVAISELNSVSTAKKNEVESLTGLSFGAIADYTQRAADCIETLLSRVDKLEERVRELEASLERKKLKIVHADPVVFEDDTLNRSTS